MMEQFWESSNRWLKRHPVKWLPDFLTRCRMFSTPIIFGGLIVFEPMDNFRWGLLFIYATVALFDFFDGFLARTWGVCSSWGARWDPRADKIIIVGGLGSMSYMLWSANNILFAAVIAACLALTVARDMIVDRYRNCVKLPASSMAKKKTALQMFGLGFLVVGHAGDRLVGSTNLIGVVILTIATTMVVWTGVQYHRQYLRCCS